MPSAAVRMLIMQRFNDKYGRGSAAMNGAEFVDLESGDTFSGLEAKLRLVQTVIYENRMRPWK